VVLVTNISFESSTIGVEVVVITDPQHVESLIAETKVHLSACLTPILLLNFVNNTANFRSYHINQHMVVSLDKNTGST